VRYLFNVEANYTIKKYIDLRNKNNLIIENTVLS